MRRYLLSNIRALNFVCEETLNGGGFASFTMGNLGKCFGSSLLRMVIEAEDELLREAGVRTAERSA